jgi:hypothetical protein
MKPHRISSSSLVVALVLVGCTPLRNPEPASVTREGGAIVLTGAALEDGPGSVLAAMMGKVPNFRVQRTDRCPLVTLRGAASFQGVANPHVYVDGTRATDTCVLEMLRVGDVGRVEVYPQGYTTRPGYGTHAPGLILVFMRSGRRG